MLASPNFIVNPTATLQLDNNANASTTSVNLADRISDTAGVTLNAGTLNFIANPGTGDVATAESVRGI